MYILYLAKLKERRSFQQGSGLSVKATMPLSATLPLAVGLNFFWFLTALLLYPKSAILGLSFLNPKDLCLPNQFSRGSWQKRSLSTYLTWCQRRNWVASMIELTLIFNPSYVCCPTIWTFSGQHFFQNFLGVSEQNSPNLGIT